MEYYKDLLRKNKNSKAQLILGIIFLLISIFWIISKYIDHTHIRIFDWIYSIFFFLNGAVQILEGIGISSNKIFGKAYLRINADFIDIKPIIFEKSQKILWDDINEIEIKSSSIVIAPTIGKHLIINYGTLDFKTVSEIKEKIISVARSKNIQPK